MCVPHDAHPPITALPGSVAAAGPLLLTAADGNEFCAYAASAADAEPAGIVVLPDVRGIFPFYEELAMRFAERGVDAVTIDYFGRTAGTDTRDADFDYMPHVQATTLEGITADVAAAVGHLRTNAAGRPVFVVGFCFGGSGAWLQASAGHGLAGAVGFYGNPIREREGSPVPIAMVASVECPILGLMGGADEGIPASAVAEYAAALEAAGVRHEFHTYPGAPHSFFDRSYEEHAAASEDAWGRTLEFIAANS